LSSRSELDFSLDAPCRVVADSRNRYKWKRAGAGSKELSCVMERGRDDPPVEVALYLPAGKHDRSRLQILHYNLQRFYGEDIKDLRGLETLFIMT
jgi:hypothetical protein